MGRDTAARVRQGVDRQSQDLQHGLRRDDKAPQVSWKHQSNLRLAHLHNVAYEVHLQKQALLQLLLDEADKKDLISPFDDFIKEAIAKIEIKKYLQSQKKLPPIFKLA